MKFKAFITKAFGCQGKEDLAKKYKDEKILMEQEENFWKKRAKDVRIVLISGVTVFLING